jgi:hypothetical protein
LANIQSERTRRNWENLFHLDYTTRNGWIVKNRATDKFGNGFFEQRQPFLAQFSGTGCKAGDVAAGTGKAFSQAQLNRICRKARHNNGNRLGRILDHPDRPGPYCYYDDIKP